MKKQARRKCAAAFKAKVALEAVKNQQTLAELAKKFDVNTIMISRWKAELLANLGSVFEKSGKAEEPDVDTQEWYAQIGQLKVENEFLKKSFKRLGGVDERANLISPGVKKISVRRPCELLSVNRSRLYYKPVGEKPENIKMMEIMDKHLTDHPTEGLRFFGAVFNRQASSGRPKAYPAAVEDHGAPNHLPPEKLNQTGDARIY